jgi:hypothetical protein
MTLLALALICTQDAMQKPITFESRAARVSALIPDLAQKSGLKLEINPQMAREVLVVSAKEMPLKVLLDKIASVTSGEWRQEGEVYRLQPSTVARNRENQEEAATRLAWVRKAIADRVKAASARADTPAGAPPAFGQEQGITNLLKGVDPTPIAWMDGGDRVVYSTKPTAMQRPLGAGAPAIIARVVANHNASVTDTPPDMADLDKMPDFIKQMVSKRMKKVQGVQKGLLIVSKPGFGMVDMTNLELRLYDEKGAVVYTESSMLTSFDFATLSAPGGKPPAPPSPKSTEITYSADSKALLSGFQGATFSGGNLNLDAKLMEKLRRPDLHDPLSYMATDELLSLSKLKGKALVANVPDSLMGSINTLVPGGKQTVEAFEADLKKGETVSLSETDGWLVVKPARPINSRNNRTDRVALASLMKATVDKGLASLDDIAAYALTSPSPMQDGIGMLFGMTLIPGLFQQGIDGMTDWNALRFYGTLSTTQKQAARQGSAIQVGYLNADQQTLWKKIAFGATTQIRTGEPKEDEMPFAFAMSMMGGNSSDYRQEPTELMPTGLPPAAQIIFAHSVQPMASMVAQGDGTPMGYMGVLGPDELALFRLFKEDAGMSAVSGAMPSLDKLKIGERSIIRMTLQLPEQAFIRTTLYDNRMPKDAPTVSMGSLPEPFQKLVAQRLEALKKSPFGSLGALLGGMGQGPIKP